MKCENDAVCCFAYGWDWVPKYYNEIFTDHRDFRNILTGSPQFPSLPCGYYARSISISTENYITYQSPNVTTGSRESGTVYVDCNTQWGSLLRTSMLDGNGTATHEQIPVLRDASRNDSILQASTALYAFVGAASVAFNRTFNFSEMVTYLKEQIPLLQYQVAELINVTLPEQAATLAERRFDHQVADDDFIEGLRLWLPLLFLVPGGLALIYFIISKCAAISNVNIAEDWVELERAEDLPGVDSDKDYDEEKQCAEDRPLVDDDDEDEQRAGYGACRR